jgi:nicotinate dehydrogenase subunit B
MPRSGHPAGARAGAGLKLDPTAISVKHVQGPGCYGHNGAGGAAADAAVIAFLNPGTPVRVQWRREEEFGFEPVSPSMVVTVRATLDEDLRPIDWTTELASGRRAAAPPRVKMAVREGSLTVGKPGLARAPPGLFSW